MFGSAKHVAVFSEMRVMLHTRRSSEAWFVRRFGFEAWSEVIARDCEGYVAKDETSLYEAGPTRVGSR